MTIRELEKVLGDCFDEKTAYPNVGWSKENPTLGQCAVTALVIQKYFGGEILKHNKFSHYFNVIDGKVVDLTKDQFDFELDYSDSIKKQPNLDKACTRERFELLFSRVQRRIEERDEDELVCEIKACKKCGNLPKLGCRPIKKGKSRVLVLGESPAKDGWIVSGRAFYNKDGKLQASGKVLDRLLRLCGLTIDDINFTEVCKCIISDRKTLRKCCENCRPILLRQLKDVDCDIILPMGQFPTETILGRKIEKLSDVVGQKFEVDFDGKTKIVIPIYHTSPANPLCFKGNEKIFDNLAKLS